MSMLPITVFQFWLLEAHICWIYDQKWRVFDFFTLKFRMRYILTDLWFKLAKILFHALDINWKRKYILEHLKNFRCDMKNARIHQVLFLCQIAPKLPYLYKNLAKCQSQFWQTIYHLNIWAMMLQKLYSYDILEIRKITQNHAAIPSGMTKLVRKS